MIKEQVTIKIGQADMRELNRTSRNGKKWNNEIRNLNGLDTAEEGIDELEDGIEEITQNAVLERQWSGK